MTINEKYNRIESLFNQQKELFQKINLKNYFDTAFKIRQLEFQKEIIKAIPTTPIPNYKKGCI